MEEVRCNAWVEQNLNRLSTLFPENTIDVKKLFVQTCHSINPSTDRSTIGANIILTAAVQVLAHIHDTENTAVRKHFVRFLEYLDDAENSLQRAFQLYQKYPPKKPRNHPPQQVINN